MKKSIGTQTIVHPMPVFVVGTYDKQGKANAMTVAWGGICCSKPPCVAISVRAATYTYGNLMEKKAFTVNIPAEENAKQADYFGMVSGKTVDKFAATGLTPVKSEIVDAPYVKEFPLTLECAVINVVEIGLHTQFIGEIKDVKVEESAIQAGGIVDIAKIRPFVYDFPTTAYYGLGDSLGKAFSIGKAKK